MAGAAMTSETKSNFKTAGIICSVAFAATTLWPLLWAYWNWLDKILKIHIGGCPMTSENTLEGLAKELLETGGGNLVAATSRDCGRRLAAALKAYRAEIEGLRDEADAACKVLEGPWDSYKCITRKKAFNEALAALGKGESE